MDRTIGILVFDGAEEMDFAGPWEVLTAAAEDGPGDSVVLIAETTAPVTCEKGMHVLPDHTYADAPALHVVVVPGGSGARREIANRETTEWRRRGPELHMDHECVYGAETEARTRSYIAYDYPPRDSAGLG